jgi:hypothetical protein
MRATLLLCDYAEAVNGKLYVMGAGWNVLYAVDRPVNTAVAALIEVPWDQTNQRSRLRVELVTADGEQVSVMEQQVAAVGEFEIGRPPGVKPGTSFNAPFAWNFTGLILPAGGYEWRLTINDDPVASRAFVVAYPPGATPPA